VVPLKDWELSVIAAEVHVTWVESDAKQNVPAAQSALVAQEFPQPVFAEFQSAPHRTELSVTGTELVFELEFPEQAFKLAKQDWPEGQSAFVAHVEPHPELAEPQSAPQRTVLVVPEDDDAIPAVWLH